MNECITPCDRISIPVYLTYCNENGVRADKEMFSEHRVIVLRWHDGRRDRQRLVSCPKAWRDEKNYFDPDTRKWKYE